MRKIEKQRNFVKVEKFPSTIFTLALFHGFVDADFSWFQISTKKYQIDQSSTELIGEFQAVFGFFSWCQR